MVQYLLCIVCQDERLGVFTVFEQVQTDQVSPFFGAEFGGAFFVDLSYDIRVG